MVRADNLGTAHVIMGPRYIKIYGLSSERGRDNEGGEINEQDQRQRSVGNSGMARSSCFRAGVRRSGPGALPPGRVVYRSPAQGYAGAVFRHDALPQYD